MCRLRVSDKGVYYCKTFDWLLTYVVPSLSFITHAYPPERKKGTGSVMTYAVLIVASVVRSGV